MQNCVCVNEHVLEEMSSVLKEFITPKIDIKSFHKISHYNLNYSLEKHKCLEKTLFCLGSSLLKSQFTYYLKSEDWKEQEQVLNYAMAREGTWISHCHQKGSRDTLPSLS